MQVALRGISGLGLGAGASSYCWNDFGAGITPGNYQSQCCLPGIGTNLFSMDCNTFAQGNSQLWTGSASDPCSDAAAQVLSLTIPPCLAALPNPVAPLAPPLVTSGGSTPVNPLYGQAIIPQVTCPASLNLNPCPCDGVTVVNTPTDAANLQLCQTLQQQAANNAAVTAQMSANASAQCAAQTVTCAQNWLLTAPTSDCTGCQLNTGSFGLWLGIGAAILATVWLLKLR